MSARLAAVEVVLAAEKSDRFIDQVLSARLRDEAFELRDRAFLTELVYGSVRHRLTLNCILAAYATRPLHRSPHLVVEALRQALYQCFFLDRVPVAAAVNEAVSLVRDAVAEPVARFANAVLRKATGGARRVAELRPGEDPRAFLPVREGKAFLFDRPIFADPASNPLDHLAETLSFPAWLIGRWVTRLGLDEARLLARAQNEAPVIVLRVQPLRTAPERFHALLEESRIAFRVLEDPGLVQVEGTGAVESIPGYADGLFSVQDRNASRVVPLLDPQPGEVVLDVCAAPGGKATQIAERQGDRGKVVAADLSQRRLALVEENAQRLGLRSIETLLLDGREAGSRFPGRFDRVLVDAPCSNTGVLSRRPDARWNVGEEALSSLVALQRELLASAAAAVRPGGWLVYSTCSLEPEENEGAVDSFLRSDSSWTLEGRLDRWPHRDGGDGAFAARLGRAKGSTPAGEMR